MECFQARYWTTCPVCGDVIEPGQWVGWDEGVLIHQECDAWDEDSHPDLVHLTAN